MPTSAIATQDIEPHLTGRKSANGNVVPQREAKEKSCEEIENQDGAIGPKGASNAVSIRERLKHFTWSWFTSTMGTGGLAIALGVTPHRFRGLTTIGLIIFLLNIFLFLLFTSLMTTRLILSPARFRKSFTHPPESFFIGSYLLTIATILGGTQLYGLTLPSTPQLWLIPVLRIFYWLYASISLLNAIIQYFLFITRTPSRPIPMNPSWFLPGYSAMLTGTIASLIAPSQPPHHRVPIIVSGAAYKGFGWTISLILLVMYITRLLESGLPHPDLRPAMFIPVGSAAYTVVAFIGLARAIPRGYGWFAEKPGAADALQAVALFSGVMLWVVAFWLFGIAVLGCGVGAWRALVHSKHGNEMRFTMAWWGFVFPNVGFTVATVEIGKELGSEAVLWVGSVMTALLVLVWLAMVGVCVRAVWRGRVVFPGKDEDKDM
ncbi:hypothetical protein K491DRAFT_647624 [Lophiostoma macrostomum CBS 122681]|uniref:C4-dicarboxylate transporter/malic acid transport protein n=1 Tax=Lophiostoma macrostomum CBS 122681 TaxID=1314788 RepID=A0A6A6TPC5_9PLEO|nr:hypothetical protein K491DRAFT_647624 [Lophiostoma macrostomum CBS 122681]